MVVYKCAMDKGKGSAHLEKFQKDKESPAHGASEESQRPSEERFKLERQEMFDEIGSESSVNGATETPMNNPTVFPKSFEDGDEYESTVDEESSAKRRKLA